jgi:hypothetical protein
MDLITLVTDIINLLRILLLCLVPIFKLAYRKYKAASAHFIKAYEGNRGMAPFILNLVTPGSCTLEKETQHPLSSGWVGSRAGLDVLQKRKIFCTFQDSNTISSSLVTTPINCRMQIAGKIMSAQRVRITLFLCNYVFV